MKCVILECGHDDPATRARFQMTSDGPGRPFRFYFVGDFDDAKGVKVLLSRQDMDILRHNINTLLGEK